MAMSRSLLLAETRRERSPREVLLSVNRLLRQLGEPNMFVSVFYAVIDIQSHKMSYSRAGHDRPLLLRSGELIPLVGSGAVLGPLEEKDLNLSEENLELLPGDRLVLFTDGLADALDGESEMFEMHRLESTLRESVNLPAEAMCSAVFKAVADFQGEIEQFDDMTMMVVEVR
jgi:sigma-B regulation protein RsbU (phosphoserine phosphatase)